MRGTEWQKVADVIPPDLLGEIYWMNVIKHTVFAQEWDDVFKEYCNL